MNLPLELWMQLFENSRLDDVVREKRANVSAVSIATVHIENEGVTSIDDSEAVDQVEEAAVKQLLSFERQAWKTGRCFYHINSNSRAAACKLRLSSKLMLGCKAPLTLLNAIPFSTIYTTPLDDDPCVHKCPKPPISSGQLNGDITLEIYGTFMEEYVGGDDAVKLYPIETQQDFLTSLLLYPTTEEGDLPYCKCVMQAKRIDLLAAFDSLDPEMVAFAIGGALDLRWTVVTSSQPCQTWYAPALGHKHEVASLTRNWRSGSRDRAVCSLDAD